MIIKALSSKAINFVAAISGILPSENSWWLLPLIPYSPRKLERNLPIGLSCSTSFQMSLKLDSGMMSNCSASTAVSSKPKEIGESALTSSAHFKYSFSTSSMQRRQNYPTSSRKRKGQISTVLPNYSSTTNSQSARDRPSSKATTFAPNFTTTLASTNYVSLVNAISSQTGVILSSKS